jgi:hypothetical protein
MKVLTVQDNYDSVWVASNGKTFVAIKKKLFNKKHKLLHHSSLAMTFPSGSP